jgi:hypothetical protein
MSFLRNPFRISVQKYARLAPAARCMSASAQLYASHLPPPPVKSSKWKRTCDIPLTRANYLELLHGYTPLIKESNFLSVEQCKDYEALMSRKLTPYKHNTGPLLTKYGVAQFEYQAQAADDFLKRTNGEQALAGKP